MKTFLHVGCGPKRKDQTTRGFNTPEWNELRLDIDEAVNPDIVGTMTDMAGVADASVDALFSSHNIEHLYPHEVPVALAEFKRVLKPDGFVVITCPDLQSVCALIADDKLTEPAYTSPAGPIAPLDILYGHRPPMARGNLYMAHRCGFTQKVLTGTLQASGFAAVAARRREHPNYDLWALATVAPMPEAELRVINWGQILIKSHDLADVPRGTPGWGTDNPTFAARDFAAKHPEFVIEQPAWPFNESSQVHNITHWPGAWLKRL